MLIDTHAHLDFPDFANDLEEVLHRAEEVEVTRIITIGTSGRAWGMACFVSAPDNSFGPKHR